MKLIDKDTVVAEIERRKKYYENIQMIKPVYESNIEDFNELLSFLDTLEVKEVNLDKEIRRYRMNNPIIGHREGTLYDYMANAAKHFFELGLKAQKGDNI